MKDLRIHEGFERGEPCRIRFENQTLTAYRGETVAVALMAAGVRVLGRSTKYHRARSAFCLRGHCASCLLRIDGVPNVKSCQALVRDGMQVERQNAFPSAGLDLFSSLDWLIPKTVDHHRMFTSSKTLNLVAQRAARLLSGLGSLPDKPADALVLQPREVELLVVGGGPAGMAAATAAAGHGVDVLLVDEAAELGGHMAGELAGQLTGGAEPQVVGALRKLLPVLQTRVKLQSRALAYYPEEGVFLVHAADATLLIKAHRVVFATGSYDQMAGFRNNDTPGILSPRGLDKLWSRYGVAAGRRGVLLGTNPFMNRLASALRENGVEVYQPMGASARLAKGGNHLRKMEIVEDARTVSVPCDFAAVWATPAPAFELPRMAGCSVELNRTLGGFVVQVDSHYRTNVDWAFAAGDVCGVQAEAEAVRSGQVAGLAAAFDLHADERVRDQLQGYVQKKRETEQKR